MQDDEYAQSLATDQARMAAARAEDERTAAEQALRTQQAAAAAELTRQESNRVELRRQRLDSLRATLRPPPAEAEPRTRILMRFPDGQRFDRFFHLTDTIQAVHDYVNTQDLIGEQFALCTAHPRRVLVDLTRTLEEEQLVPRAMLNIEDRTE